MAGSHFELSETVGPASFFGRRKRGCGRKVLYLRGDLGVILRRVEQADLGNAAFAGKKARPESFDSGPQGRDSAQPSDNHSAIFPISGRHKSNGAAWADISRSYP